MHLCPDTILLSSETIKHHLRNAAVHKTAASPQAAHQADGC